MVTLPRTSPGLSFVVLEGVGKQRCPLEQQEMEVGVRMQTEEQGICGQASGFPALMYEQLNQR